MENENKKEKKKRKRREEKREGKKRTMMTKIAMSKIERNTSVDDPLGRYQSSIRVWILGQLLEPPSFVYS